MQTRELPAGAPSALSSAVMRVTLAVMTQPAHAGRGYWSTGAQLSQGRGEFSPKCVACHGSIPLNSVTLVIVGQDRLPA